MRIETTRVGHPIEKYNKLEITEIQTETERDKIQV